MSENIFVKYCFFVNVNFIYFLFLLRNQCLNGRSCQHCQCLRSSGASSKLNRQASIKI